MPPPRCLGRLVPLLPEHPGSRHRRGLAMRVSPFANLERWGKSSPGSNPKRAPDKIKDAVPVRMGAPRRLEKVWSKFGHSKSFRVFVRLFGAYVDCPIEDRAKGHEIPDASADVFLRPLGPSQGTDYPQDVMVIGLCQKDGGGIVKFRWLTHNRVLTKEFLIPRALPGEVVTVGFGKVSQKRWPRGDMDIYVNPHVERVRPSVYEMRAACPHYSSCGGCDFLDLKYGRQLVEKQRWIQQALKSGKISPITLKKIRPSTPQQRYAFRMEWMIREDDGDVLIGPKGYAPTQRPTGEPLHGCVLAPRGTIRILSIFTDVFMQLRELRRRSYSVYDDVKSWGTFRSVVALSTKGPRRADGQRRSEVLLNIVVGNEPDIPGVLQPLANAIVEAAPKSLVGIVANLARSNRTIMGGRREYLLYGRRYVNQAFDVHLDGETHSFLLEMGAGSRLAAHAGLLPELSESIAEMCGLSETDVLWHCFCSGGELSLALGRVCQQVVAIGTSATEVGCLKRNLAANKVTNTTAVLCNLQSPFTLKQLSFHISQSQQKRLLLGTGLEQDKAREYALTCFVPGESRRRLIQRLTAAPFNAPLLREDAMASQELRALLPAFVRDFRPNLSTLPVPVVKEDGRGEEKHREVPEEMEGRLKRLYRRLALKYHPDRNPNDPEASERFQALTKAYKALVGDTAGPEEGDEDAKDPFQVAHEHTYRIRSKEFWRHEGNVHQGSRFKQKKTRKSDDSEEMDEVDDTEAKVTEAFGRSDDEDEDEESWEFDDSDLVIEMEIDSGWAQKDSNTTSSWSQEKRHKTSAHAESDATEVQLKDGDTRLTQAGTDEPAPTLAPPDVILVCQPRNRKKGRGTPRYFQSWLRSTAARAIIYVSEDVEAFQADAGGLRDLGYQVTKLQPFDSEPHRKPILMVAKFELIRPLEGLEEYKEHGEQLLPGMPGFLPTNTPQPLLVSGGYRAIPPPR